MDVPLFSAPSSVSQLRFRRTRPSITPLRHETSRAHWRRRPSRYRCEMQAEDDSQSMKHDAPIENRTARKSHITNVILSELPNSIDRGWGSLIQWTGRSFFSQHVNYQFPFLQNECGRFEIHVLLATMHYLTIWRSLESRIEDLSTQTPSPDLLIINYSIVADMQFAGPDEDKPEEPLPSSSLRVRMRVHFDENGDIDSWVEDWSRTQRDFCREVMERSEEFTKEIYEKDFVMDEQEKSFARFTDNKYLEEDPRAKEMLDERLPRLIDFLSYKFPQLSLLGSNEMTSEETDELYSFFSDDVEIDTPIGELHGRLALELVFPFSQFVAKLFFKTIAMEVQSVQQPGKRIVTCTYATKAISRLGGAIAFTTRSVFYLDKVGRIAKQTDFYSRDPFSIASSHFRRSWWSF